MKKLLLILLLVLVMNLIGTVAFAVPIDPLNYTGPLPIADVTGNIMFDTFFSLILFFGLGAFIIYQVCKIVNRS